MPRSIPHYCLSLLLFLLLCPAEFLAQELVVETESQFVIDETESGEPLIRPPVRAATFDNGSIVVGYLRSSDLHLYDSSGAHLRTFGGRGRGPFEFLDISYLFVNEADQLVVYDNYQAKRSIFDQEKGRNERSTPFGYRPHIRNIHQKPDGSYLIGMRRQNTEIGSADNYLFYLMERDYTVTDTGMVTPDQLHEEGENSPANFIMGGGSNTEKSVLTGRGDLVLAPALYNGRILVYRNATDYKNPDIIDTKEYHRPYREYEGSLPESFETRASSLINLASGPGFSVKYYQFNRSMGLFRTSNGYIVHFAQEWDAKQEHPRLWLEVLDQNAERLLGIREVEALGKLKVEDAIRMGDTTGYIFLQMLHMDGNDNLFVAAETEDAEYELHVVNLHVRYHSEE